jgi:hypothetical protein
MARPIAELDTFLTLLGASIPVGIFLILSCKYVITITIDVMPGEHDPANLSLPQQPFNACLLPLSNRIGTCRSVTNPYEAEIGGRVSSQLVLVHYLFGLLDLFHQSRYFSEHQGSQSLMP